MERCGVLGPVNSPWTMFAPRARVGAVSAGRGARNAVKCSGRIGEFLAGGFLQSRRLSDSAPFSAVGWTLGASCRRFSCPTAAGRGGNDKGKKGPSSRDAQGRGNSPDKREKRDNVWSSGKFERSRRPSPKKDTGENKGQTKNSGKPIAQPYRAAQDSNGRVASGSSPPNTRIKDGAEEVPPLEFISPILPIESETLLHPEESFAHPLWTTFCSSTSGVWRGVGAAFSPITAAMEPIYLSKEKEYIYDARILNTVEAVRTSQDGKVLPLDQQCLHRRVLWNLENSLGEQVKLDEEEVRDYAKLDSFLTKSAVYDEQSSSKYDPAAWDALVDAKGEGKEAEWESLLGNQDEIDQSWEAGRTDTLEVMENVVLDAGSIREDGPEWKMMWGRGEVLDSEWEGLGLPPGESEKISSIAAFTSPHMTKTGPTYAEDHLTNALGTTWADVMEEDIMDREEGLVYFEDGSYSRGPVQLLTEASTSGREYYNAYTCKIEQCLVAGGHKRLRIVHTISVEEDGEEVEVLRVAVYEEDWMGPCNMKLISDAGGQQLKLFSERPRHAPEDLVGSWKVFEKEAKAVYAPKAEKPDLIHSCKEVAIRRGLPDIPELPQFEDDKPMDMSDFSVLWLTGGTSTYVDVSEKGVLTFGIGWLCENGSRLVMERVYGSDGKLMHVKSKTEIESST